MTQNNSAKKVNKKIEIMNSLLKSQKAKFIYNPYTGRKRKLNPLHVDITLKEIKILLVQYQIRLTTFLQNMQNVQQNLLMKV